MKKLAGPWLLSVTLLLPACTSQDPPAPPAPNAHPDAGGGAGPPVGCDPTALFTPVPWATPTAFSSACTQTQVATYHTCLTIGGDNCASFRADPANASCVACIETDVGAPLHGPIVTSGTGPALQVVQVNWGGCIATRDMDTSAGSCGAKFNVFNDCYVNDCSSCLDANNPAQNGPTVTCTMTAFATGSCAGDKVATACDQEINSDAGVANACGPQILDLVATWCAAGMPVDAGAMEAGGAGGGDAAGIMDAAGD